MFYRFELLTEAVLGSVGESGIERHVSTPRHAGELRSNSTIVFFERFQESRISRASESHSDGIEKTR